jgi:hypothetical protein
VPDWARSFSSSQQATGRDTPRPGTPSHRPSAPASCTDAQVEILNPAVLDPAAIIQPTVDDDAAAATSLGRRGGARGNKPPRPGPDDPPVGSPGPDPPGPQPDFPTPPNFGEQKCISDPEEFARVFNEGTIEGEQARCDLAGVCALVSRP